jgi:opacity protein-like surface antigen
MTADRRQSMRLVAFLTGAVVFVACPSKAYPQQRTENTTPQDTRPQAKPNARVDLRNADRIWPVDLDPYLKTAMADPEPSAAPGDTDLGPKAPPTVVASASDEPGGLGSESAESTNGDMKDIGPKPNPWRLEFSPYLWLADISGKATVYGVKAGMDVKSSQLRQDSKAAVMATARFYNNDWVILLDGLYMNFANQLFTTGGDTEIDVTNGFLMLAAGRRFKLFVPTEVFAGARYNISHSKLNTRITSISLYEETQWVDPVIGARVLVPLAKRLSFDLAADVGGYEVNSNMSWEFIGHFSYEFFRNMSAEIGYRVMDTDYEKDGFELDYTSHGPIFGLKLKF